MVYRHSDRPAISYEWDFVLIGAKLLHFSDFVINLFMGGTLAEVFGIVLVMARYLFSEHV